MTTTQNIIPRNTAAAMAENFAIACDEINRGFALLRTAEARLGEAFEGRYGFDVLRARDGRNCDGVDEKSAAQVLARLKCNAWQAISQRLNMRAVLTEKRCAELNKQLENAELLPELTPDNIAGMFAHLMGNFETYQGEIYKEAFDFLCRHSEDYKTASVYGLGDKSICSWSVETGYCGQHWRVNYQRHQELKNVDNVFHLLDGKGPACGTGKSYQGPLCDAIEAAGADGKGSTDYFRFRCFQNRNLHVWFLRPDLVDLLNEKCGCTILPKKTPARPAQPSTASTSSTTSTARPPRPPMDRGALEKSLRATWSANNVPEEKQNEMIARFNRAA